MYHSPTALTPALVPEQYHAPEAYRRECAHVLGDAWHLMGPASQISQPGEYLSADVLGVPVLVRNFDGELVAMRNVCAHRQCALVSKPQGQSESLKCPFHGWVYGSDGRTRRIPAAANFPHFDREQHRLDRFETATCGDLLFVRLSETGLTLQEWMGPLFAQFEQRFSRPDFAYCESRELEYPANWKIPVETSLESYHIPEVHPDTFGEDPGESESEHAFHDRSSSFFTEFHASRWTDVWLNRVEEGLLRFIGADCYRRYEHHHIFPHLLASFTHSLSLIHVVMPLSPTTSVGRVWHFARMPGKQDPVREMVANTLGHGSAFFSFRVVKEDISIYPHVQTGVESGAKPGILGRCEERLHAFQTHVASRLSEADHVGANGASANGVEANGMTTCDSVTARQHD